MDSNELSENASIDRHRNTQLEKKKKNKEQRCKVEEFEEQELRD